MFYVLFLIVAGAVVYPFVVSMITDRMAEADSEASWAEAVAKRKAASANTATSAA